MAHQSLYRKYRPQTFADVVGQDHIERTLRNAVGDGTVAHAYLFTGPRGTGKTTTARLLAKALNCDHGPTADPDGTCEQCIEIADGRHADVYELDAASRTGVDNVREEIIGRVQFAPTKGRYKVYIIDEVHMLSTAAFNALLKTLEEPPPHVVFVLATTHPHKVPETIQSRCQRFDFHRIGIDEIVGRLRVICDGEEFDVPDAALALIARHAAGGMRDAITTLEQLASFTGGTILVADVEGLLGEVDSAQLFEIAGLVAKRDVAGCFRWVARFAEEGTDLAEFVRELTAHTRDLYLISAVGDGHGIVDAPAEDLVKLESQAAEFGGPDRLARMLDLLGELGSEMRWSSDPRLSLEVALTRMARPVGEMTLEALAERVEALEAGTSARVVQVSETAPSQVAPKATAAHEPVPAPESTSTSVPPPALAKQPESPSAAESTEPPSTAGASSPGNQAAPTESPAPHATPATLNRAAAKRAWPAVLVEIKKLKPARAQMYGQVEIDMDPDGETMVLEFSSDQSFAMQMAEEPEMRDMLKRAVTAVLGFAPPTRFQLGRGGVRASANPVTAAPALVAPAPNPAPSPTPTTEVANEVVDEDATAALKRQLIEDLGVDIVAEHAAGTDTQDVAGTSQEPDVAEVVGQDFGIADPELFDDTDGEDD